MCEYCLHAVCAYSLSCTSLTSSDPWIKGVFLCILNYKCAGVWVGRGEELLSAKCLLLVCGGIFGAFDCQPLNCTVHVLFCSWNEWVTIPILLKDIPKTAQLAMTVYDIYGPGKAIPVGGTTVSLFGKRGLVFAFIKHFS